jgi:hypothetical protein
VQVNRVAQWNPFRRGGAAVRCGLLGVQCASISLTRDGRSPM